MQNQLTTLSKKHKLFISAWDGDIITAMQVAGFNGPPSSLKSRGQTLLKDPLIIQGIEERRSYQTRVTHVVANREERQAFWSDIMKNKDPYHQDQIDQLTGTTKPPEPIPLAIRLQASVHLGKSEADFMDKIDMSGNITVSDIISQAYQVENEHVDNLEVESQKRLAIARTKALKKQHDDQPQIEEAQLVTPAAPSLTDMI